MPKEDGPLEEYRRKRDFARTPEPPGGEGKGAGIFVVHRHSARALHYDLRLELGGVLKSWAVPKGPSTNPEDKRLCVHVEDHPVEYAGFEGVIPKGEYGAGTVMVWDRGFWVPEGDPRESYRKGAIKFALIGSKLKGRWNLVRLKKRPAEEKDEWILIKEKDEKASTGDITAEQPFSAATGRSMEEIAASPEARWTAEGFIEGRPLEVLLGGAVPATLPPLLSPQLATLTGTPPEGDDWLHEIKYDGYRVMARAEGGDVRLYTRNGNDWTGRFPTLASLFSTLPLLSAWIDGEVVHLKDDGTTDFEGVQNAMALNTDAGLIYFAFDLLYYNGYDLSSVALRERKELLKYLLEGRGGGMVRYGDHVEGSGGVFFSRACAHNVEGIISKKKYGPFIPGRTKEWIKIKCLQRQEFVVGGYTEAKGARFGFGALLTGVYDEKGGLVYTGRVGTGFNEETLASIKKLLKGLVSPSPPFTTPPTGPEAKGVHWVRPELVIEVEFSQWTREGVLRHPSFKGIREDKAARDVVKEVPEKLSQPAQEKKEYGPLPFKDLKVHLSNPGKILYPETGLTKKDIALYYAFIAERMLPHLRGRPLTLVRCPEGYQKGCFFQKHMDWAPPSLKPVEFTENDGTMETYMTADSREGLLALVQMGVLEVHTIGSRKDRLEYPDKATFDIDPAPDLDWGRTVEAVFLLKGVLEELGLVSFLKTTGGKGLHLVIPLGGTNGWEEVKAFTKAVAEFVSKGIPGRFTSMMTKSRREGRIFLDYMRNIRGATAIEAYSTRAKAGAPLAVPVSWEEALEVRPDTFNVRNIHERIKDMKKDPWEGFFELRQSITGEMMERVGARK